ncbi:SprT-like family-domain-containing protein [Biscogniauxia marginata]|nr:SprT-like family-domain-containing protein [Biscogniauxia marginata]
MACGSSSEDEFPNVDMIVRKQKQKVRGNPGGGSGKEDVPAAEPSSKTARASKSRDQAGPNTSVSLAAAKSTPLRRRKLGPVQTVDGSLLKPWTGIDTDEGSSGRISKSKVSSRVRSREGSAESKPDSARGLPDRLPVRTQEVEPIASSPVKGLDSPPEQPKKSRRLISRRDLKLKRGGSTKVVMSEKSSSEPEVESEATGDDFEPREDSLSDFISTGDTEMEASNSDSDVFITPPTRRSKSPTDRRQRPLRLLSLSKELVKKDAKRAGQLNNRDQPTAADPTKRSIKQPLEEKAKSKNLKGAQKGNLEDAFQKLQIFNEDWDSDSENTNVKGVKNSTREPSTPKKTALPPSPSKGPKIPASPWKPEHKEFWDPEVNFAWIDKHSPPKRSSPEKKLDLTGGRAADSNSKTELKRRYGNSPEKRDAKKAFDAAKESLARDFLHELDERITEGRLAQMTEATGGLRIVWSNTLLTTAGRAHWKCKTVTTTTSSQRKEADGTTLTTTANTTQHQHHASIELASKVLANRADLLNTVAHEFCHLAVFMLNGKPKTAHGPEFKAWGRRCGQAFADRGIEVTTKHSYEIEYKYIWRCAGCAGEVKRHSKSVDPQRQRCGACRGVLVQVKPTPRGNNSGGATASAGDGEEGASEGGGKAATTGVKKKQSAWQEFMAKEMKMLSQNNKGMSFKDRMAYVSARWAEQQKAVRGLASAVEVLEIRDGGAAKGEGDGGDSGDGNGEGKTKGKGKEEAKVVAYDLFA